MEKSNKQLTREVIARNYPNIDAENLCNALFRLARKCEANAMGLCNDANHKDQREAIREEFKKICVKFGVELKATLSGDPRGYCLFIHFPDESYNTWGEKESGYGIGRF